MRDRVIPYAVIISVVLHLAVAAVVGRASIAKLRTASIVPVASPRTLKVDFVDDPFKIEPPKKAVSERMPEPEPERRDEPKPIFKSFSNRITSIFKAPKSHAPVSAAKEPVRTAPRPVKSTGPAGNPGGKLNVGTASKGGDLGGNWGGGRTPVGWVPGDDNGRGRGSGNGRGEGTPEPVKGAEDGPNARPSPPPPPPPPPKMVSVRICGESGMLAGDYCKAVDSKSFVDGDEPRRTCGKCKAPEHKSRLADQAKPVLIGDSKVAIPSSVEEGLSVKVRVEYTVTADGDVGGVEVVQSSGNKTIDKAVVNAAGKLKYKPAVQDGTPRSVKISRTYSINT